MSIDPVSLFVAGLRAGTSVGNFLFGSVERYLELVNNTRVNLYVALCVGDVSDSFSGGWIHVYSGERQAVPLPISRSGTKVHVHARTQDGSRTWGGGGDVFYVGMPRSGPLNHSSYFAIKDARTTAPATVQGTLRPVAVKASTFRMYANDTFTFTP